MYIRFIKSPGLWRVYPFQQDLLPPYPAVGGAVQGVVSLESLWLGRTHLEGKLKALLFTEGAL